ncbi:MAG: hypothetical protein ABUT20_09305 [Bacteroidota bacterium]
MKIFALLIFLAGTTLPAMSQTGIKSSFHLDYDPALQPSGSMQYFKPAGNLFVGDCIPFYHDGTYYLYWLLDSGHHSALNGLGGHQWALSTSTDLKTWKHFPIVLGIDEEWEKSICTGSVVFYNKKFYAFYATRLVTEDGTINEKLSYAVSDDGIHFKKQLPNPFYSYAPGYSKRNFRDPKVTVDSAGIFHLFVSSATDSSISESKGAMVHLVSKDLKNWSVRDPLIINQDDVPECPDYFKWHDWYYLVYGRGGSTYYLKSKKPYGPWVYPESQALNEDWSNVVKTAEFTNGRRIAAGWIPSRRENKDNGGEIFGGCVVLREVIQDADGTLLTKFLPEVFPANSRETSLVVVSDKLTTRPGNASYNINSPNGTGAAFFENIPLNCRVTLDIEPSGNVEEYGLALRAEKGDHSGYKLRFLPDSREVYLHNSGIHAVAELNKKIKVEVIMKGDIIDVCVDNKRCIVNRLIERKGSRLWIYAKHGNVKFSSIHVTPLDDK